MTVFDREDRRSREETAALLRAVAADFERHEAFGFPEDRVGVPEEMDVELELERESDDDEGETFELEVEIEWTDADLPDVEARGAEASPTAEETAGDERDESEGDAAFDDTDAAPGAPDDATTEAAETGEGDEGAEEVDSPEGEEVAPPSLAGFQVYRDRGGEWRWRLVHRNGNIIATSGEGYTSRQNAEKGMRSVMKNAPGAEVTRE